MTKDESIKKYIDRFWDLHLKACVFEEIGFQAQKHQYCASLPEGMQASENSQKPATILAVIHHSMLAYKIFYISPTTISKPSKKQKKISEKPSNGAKKNNDTKKKEKDKSAYKGSNRLSPEELEQYTNNCLHCGEQGHSYWRCPEKGNNHKKEALEALVVVSNKIEDPKASHLCYAWGRVRDQEALVLFYPGSAHNFIFIELAQKLGILTDKLGPALAMQGAFKGQEGSVTPLIKL